MSTAANQFLTFVDVLRYRALNQPDRLAFGFLGDGENLTENFTYAQLDRRARTIAAQLQAHYLSDEQTLGERALLVYPPGLEFISAFFGCLYAGVIAVPTYPPRGRTLERWATICDSCQASLILSVTDLIAQFQSSEMSLKWVATDTLQDDLEPAWQTLNLSGNTIAFLQYTSGSTGTPKGAIVTHHNLLHNALLLQQCLEDTSESKGVSWLPLYHDMGLIGGVLQPIYVGGLMYLMSPLTFLQKPYRWLQAISHYQATTSGAPNFAYELCIHKVKPEQRLHLNLGCWENAFVGAEPIRPETLTQFAQTFAACGFRPESFYPCYGMAEATLMVAGGLKTTAPTVCPVKPEALKYHQVETVEPSENACCLVSVGQPRLKLKIVDPQSLTECPANQVGEIWLSGANIVQGYWNLPNATTEIFQAYLSDTGEGPFLRTGDLGFIFNSELFVTGRLKEMIIIRGRNHYPQDIEQTVEQSHPALKPTANAAFGVEIKGVEQLVVVQEVERSYLRSLDKTEVVGQIRRAVVDCHGLQVYDVVLVGVGGVPKTSSGKTRRRACRDAFLADCLQRLV